MNRTLLVKPYVEGLRSLGAVILSLPEKLNILIRIIMNLKKLMEIR
ncbi:hypothetical protein L3N51_02264 [Metallosphaera sp. J1]|nr:hypothetical protein [Metallosphaera javensis (ex Hofmann et al. 2022)]